MSVIAMKRFPVRTRAAKSPPAVNSRPSGLLLQRKRPSGRSSELIGEREKYLTKRLPGKAFQARLRINESGDEYEQEADQVAERVMRMPDVPVDHETSSTGGEPLVQRRAGETSEAGTGVAPPIVHDFAVFPQGSRWDAATRAFFEPRFGHDFSLRSDPFETRRQKSRQTRSVRSPIRLGRTCVWARWRVRAAVNSRGETLGP